MEYVDFNIVFFTAMTSILESGLHWTNAFAPSSSTLLGSRRCETMGKQGWIFSKKFKLETQDFVG
jgi:hypothetical protein